MINTASRTMVSNHVFAEIWKNTTTGQQSLHATKSFQPGEVICHFGATGTFNKATYLTIQTGNDIHITFDPEFLQYINHSCDPNVFFNTTTMQLICLQALKADDEFTFFYPSTEWKMVQPFECYCGSKNCLQQITGAADLPSSAVKAYLFTDFIEGKLREAGKK